MKRVLLISCAISIALASVQAADAALLAKFMKKKAVPAAAENSTAPTTGSPAGLPAVTEPLNEKMRTRR